MSADEKLFLPEAILFDSHSFFNYINKLRKRLYGEISIDCLIKKAEDEHRAFRLLPLLLIQDELFWSEQTEKLKNYEQKIMQRAIDAVCVYLENEEIGHSLFKGSLKQQVEHLFEYPSIYLESPGDNMDAKNLWKDLATYRYDKWKKATSKRKNEESI